MHHLYEFVQSIFSLLFTMIRQSQTSVKAQLQQSSNTNPSQKSIATQTVEQFIFNHHKKLPTVIVPTSTPQPLRRRPQKRACMQIQIVERNIHDMDSHERRRALKKMKQAIQEQDVVVVDDKDNNDGVFLRQFQPDIQKVIYSQSNQSIRLAIDTLKQSDTSTHVFLSRFAGEVGQMDQDIVHPEELINKNVMAKTVGTYKLFKHNNRDKCRVYNHVVEEVVYPLQYRVSLNGRSGRKRVSEGIGENDDNLMPVIYQTRNLPIKRNQLPSLVSKFTQKLSVINEPISHSPLKSNTSINSKKEIKDANQHQKQSMSKSRSRQENSLSSSNLIALVGDNKSVGIFNSNAVSKSINLEYVNSNNKKQSLSKILKKQSNNATTPNPTKVFQDNGLTKVRIKTSTAYFSKKIQKSHIKLNTMQNTTN